MKPNECAKCGAWNTDTASHCWRCGPENVTIYITLEPEDLLTRLERFVQYWTNRGVTLDDLQVYHENLVTIVRTERAQRRRMVGLP